MKLIPSAFMLFALCGAGVFAADTGRASMAQMYDRELSMVEREVVSLAEAMPSDKYGFTPTNGDFKGVRTFGQQFSHIATVIYEVSAGVLGEKSPVDAGKSENGPESLKTKDAIVKYLKDAFAYGHKAMNSLTDQNFRELVASPFGDKSPRGSLANVNLWHTFDHYGQAVVYARMNRIVPPASRQQ
ncbi:MAG: DinB family protein [Bryobacteraceae bacterium]